MRELTSLLNFLLLIRDGVLGKLFFFFLFRPFSSFAFQKISSRYNRAGKTSDAKSRREKS